MGLISTTHFPYWVGWFQVTCLFPGSMSVSKAFDFVHDCRKCVDIESFCAADIGFRPTARCSLNYSNIFTVLILNIPSESQKC